MIYYSFEIYSVEKSKVGNSLIMSLSISIGHKDFRDVDSILDSFETHNVFSSLVCIQFSLFNLIISF